MVRDDLTGKFELEGYLTETTVTEGSPPVGQTVADALADLVVLSGDFLLPIAVLGLFYAVTAVLTDIVNNNASVVLMVPVAAEAAAQFDANAFAFVLAVTFAASTAFMTPVGYLTNLFVCGPGGYKFTDRFWVGAPLQLAFAVVTTFGIAATWGTA